MTQNQAESLTDLLAQKIQANRTQEDKTKDIWGVHMFPISDQGTLEHCFHNCLENHEAICEFAKRVAKVCIVRETGDNSQMVINEGTAISLSENNDLFMTAHHVVSQLDSSTDAIVVNSYSQPIFPRSRAWNHDAGWTKVEIYHPKTIVKCANCNGDYTFLKRSDLDESRIKWPPHSEVVDVIKSYILVGFLCLSEEDNLGDFIEIMGHDATSTLSTQEAAKLLENLKLKGLRRKLIVCPHLNEQQQQNNDNPNPNPNNSNTCPHLLEINCISGSGMSGGMVLSVHTTTTTLLNLLAMHIGRRNNRALSIKLTLIFNRTSTTQP